MEYRIVCIINLPSPTQDNYLNTGSSKSRRKKDPKTEDSISWSNSNTTALHSVCTIKHKNGNIKIFWKLNHNIHNRLFYGIFIFLVNFAVKILQFLGFLRISCYLEIILKECEISRDLKKILERWQHCMGFLSPPPIRSDNRGSTV